MMKFALVFVDFKTKELTKVYTEDVKLIVPHFEKDTQGFMLKVILHDDTEYVTQSVMGKAI
jgi:hypothetical protein